MPVGIEPVDLVICVADLAQDLHGVLAEPGWGCMDLAGFAVDAERSAHQRQLGAVAAPAVLDQLEGGHLRGGEGLRVVVDRTAGDAELADRLNPVRRGAGGQGRLDDFLERVLVRRAVRPVLNRGPVAVLATPRTSQNARNCLSLPTAMVMGSVAVVNMP